MLQQLMERENPGIKEILQVAKKAGIDTRHAKARAEEIEEIVNVRINIAINNKRLATFGLVSMLDCFILILLVCLLIA